MNLLNLFEKLLSLEPYFIHVGNDASFYTERDGSTLRIYFEWSNGKRDWSNNFKFAAKSITSHRNAYKDMPSPWRVHRGFLSVWDEIEPFIQRELWDPQIKHVIITGYSHGSAIALLCHEYVRFNRPDTHVESYGFGGPRVVWGSIPPDVKKRFEGFTLIRNRSDIVTHVPPFFFGYRHVGKLLTVGDHKLTPLSIIAHTPQSYIKALRKEADTDG